MSLLTSINGYYKLDESSGNAGDSSGNLRTLTNNNTVTYNTGKINNGANGGSTNTNKFLSLNNDMGIMGGPISISCWVKLNTELTSAGVYSFVSQGDSNVFVNNMIQYNYNGGTQQIQFFRQKQNVSNDTVVSNLTMGTTNFYHFVLTYDGSTLTAYVNGSSVGSTAASGNGASGTINQVYILASRGNGADEAFASAIVDEVGIWSRALTAGEVTSLYNSGSGIQYPFGISPTASSLFFII